MLPPGTASQQSGDTQATYRRAPQGRELTGRMTSKGQRGGPGLFWRSSEGGFILVEKLNETTSSQNPWVTPDFLTPRQRRDTVGQLLRWNPGVDQTRQTEVTRALIRWQLIYADLRARSSESGSLGKVICIWYVFKWVFQMRVKNGKGGEAKARAEVGVGLEV